MKTFNMDITTKLKIPLNEVTLNNLGGVDPHLEWKTRTVSAHQPPDKKDRQALEQQKERASNFFATSEGINQIQTFAQECSEVFKMLLSNPRAVSEYMEGKTFIFVTGAMRTGGTFLERKLFHLFDLDLRDYSLHMIHDSMPNSHAIQHAFKPAERNWLLFELAQFLVWAKQAFKDSNVIIKKRTLFELILPLLHSIFGDHAEYIVTVRHPIPAGFSMAKKTNYKVDVHDSPDWWKSFVLNNKPISDNEWEALNYIERFILYWQVCYEAVARNRHFEQRLKVVAYDSNDYGRLLDDLSKKHHGSGGDTRDFNLIKRNYNKVWSDEVLHNAFEEVSEWWRLNGMSFPNLALK